MFNADDGDSFDYLIKQIDYEDREEEKWLDLDISDPSLDDDM